jgi:hypothetical protein
MFITAYDNRYIRFSIEFLDEFGARVSINPASSTDETYLKIGRNTEVVFELSSLQPSPNDSSMTRNNPTAITLTQPDLLAMPAGTYDIEVGWFDASASDQMRHVQKGTFVLHATMGGDDAIGDL